MIEFEPLENQIYEESNTYDHDSNYEYGMFPPCLYYISHSINKLLLLRNLKRKYLNMQLGSLKYVEECIP